MELNPNFKEFLQLLNSHKVNYMVVGGYAVVWHGYPRYTGDLDVWIEASNENAQKLIKAVDEFGFDIEDLKAIDFSKEIIAFHLGVPPLRIDIMTHISGVNFNDATNDRVTIHIENMELSVIGKQFLLQNKRKSGRLKDLNDVINLE